MNALAEIKARFTPAIEKLTDEQTDLLLEMIRPAQDSRFGDYQVNSSMSLGKRIGQSPRDVAAKLLEETSLDDFCQKTEIAGPGFINITLDDDWIKSKLLSGIKDANLGYQATTTPKTFVVDFSSPNVAKPMHVGHIRSTVIGDAISRILRFAGHNVITDNHLGDWGTQFGMIIYGYKHFVDKDQYSKSPIDELLRIYRLVRQIIEYHQIQKDIPAGRDELTKLESALEKLNNQEKPADKGQAKKLRKEIGRLEEKIRETREKISSMEQKDESVKSDPTQFELFERHQTIGQSVLDETAKLHAGNSENVKLWNEFLPTCRKDIQRIYDRLGIEFDHEYGESFYNDQLAAVVESLEKAGIASQSEGATCVFLDQFDTPMIVRKKDGAFLYSTTDLATIKYRMDTWSADAALYVVDHRQHEHFSKLFAVAKQWGYSSMDLRHISFGTILGEDGKPFQTRAGDTVGLEGLLDEAVNRARTIVNDLDDNNPDGPQLDQAERNRVAETVGIAALKYADLSQNRMSDYKFSYDKMVNLKGNTSTYLQYSYARVQGIYRRGEINAKSTFENPVDFQFEKDVERQLALSLIRFGEAIDDVLVDFKPNILAQYLYDLANTYSAFFEACPVLKSEGSLKASRLQLCELTARTIRMGLSLLGIGVVDRM